MNLLGYARLAKAAYDSTPSFGDRSSAARAILGHTDDGVVISIPGTNNIACDLADLDIDVDQVNGLGGLHCGFNDVANDLFDYVLKVSPDVLTAHSMGAAAALILAGKLCLSGKPPKAVYAFEPPRLTTDTILAQLLKAHNVKLTLTHKGHDVVPMVPRLLHDWQHPGQLTRIGTSIHPFPNIEDHMIDSVIEALTPIEHFSLGGVRG